MHYYFIFIAWFSPHVLARAGGDNVSPLVQKLVRHSGIKPVVKILFTTRSVVGPVVKIMAEVKTNFTIGFSQR